MIDGQEVACAPIGQSNEIWFVGDVSQHSRQDDRGLGVSNRGTEGS